MRKTVDPPRRRVLVVEDDPIMARLHQRTFEGDGWDVCVAANVAEALAEIRSGGSSVVISDLHLPDGTGLDVLAAVRSTDAAVPVVFVTGSPGDEIAAEAARAGALAYFTKPVRRQDLLQAAARGLEELTRARLENG
jgi:DNA-binding NtrC family response regulator